MPLGFDTSLEADSSVENLSNHDVRPVVTPWGGQALS